LALVLLSFFVCPLQHIKAADMQWQIKPCVSYFKDLTVKQTGLIIIWLTATASQNFELRNAICLGGLGLASSFLGIIIRRIPSSYFAPISRYQPSWVR